MEYTFRLNMFTKPVTLRIFQQSLEVLDEQRKLVRRIDLKAVRKIQQFEGMHRIDPNRGRFEVQFCKLFAKRHKTVTLSNSSYTGSMSNAGEGALNHDPQYQAFVRKLKQLIATDKPDVPVVYGAPVASLLWWGCSLLGLGFGAMGVAGFVMDELGTALWMALFCFPMGAMLLFGGAAMGQRYWPKRVRLADDLRQQATAI